MKIRIISDLHTDINRKADLSWKDKDILTLIAGDVAGSLKGTKEFLRRELSNVVFIAGNHIVYNHENKPIQTLYQDLKNEFPVNSNIAFLENDYKVIDNIAIIGATLWTDFSYTTAQWAKGLPKKSIVQNNMNYAKQCMNDYRWGLACEDGRIVRLMPRHCLKMFENSMRFIQKAYDEFADSGKKIILMVHHGISPKSIDSDYIFDDINCAYITDLENYILKNLPKLSLITHGHIHKVLNFKIGKIPVICNPRGYETQNQKTGYDKNLIVEI
ncbi:MAG: metallophosphoesterase [Elusimicrobiota bacterium]|jgi:predicted phosphodiesterase|nr:metallophosphoesterase [Elusimicrobiota bacterium]